MLTYFIGIDRRETETPHDSSSHFRLIVVIIITEKFTLQLHLNYFSLKHVANHQFQAAVLTRHNNERDIDQKAKRLN